VMFFGWNKVSAGFHLASTWLTGLGATLSAWWILVANAWMQYPIGCTFNPDTMRNEMTSFLDVALSPFAIDKFTHTITSSWILGAAFTVGVSCWYLLRKRHIELAKESIKVGAAVGLVASLLAGSTGHSSAYMVAQSQPMKLAAMEALYEGGTDQSLTAVAWVNPFEQPDYMNQSEPPMRIAVPNMLSILATKDAHGYVPGVKDIIRGYKKADGTMEPSLTEKQERGRNAIQALKDYRAGKDKESNLKVLEKDMKYFGYGYIKDAKQVVPFIPVNFWSFRIMVGLGCFFILIFAVILFIVYKKDITRIFIAEAGLIGFASGAIGVLVAMGLAIPISSSIANALKIESFSANLDVKAIVGLILLSLVLTLIASIIPSRMAAKKDPVEALRTE